MTSFDDAVDYVQQGDRRRPVRTRRWVLLAVAAALVVSALLLDHRLRNHERVALHRCATTGLAVVAIAERRLSDISDYVRSALRDGPPQGVQIGLYSLVEQTAARQAPRVRRVLRDCRAVHVTRLHLSPHAARDAYVAYFAAELTRLESVAESGAHAFDSTRTLRAMRDRAARLAA
ncbi:MAG: hypothetical protein ACXVW9_03290 [Nocardioidaceae bacterium]